MCKVPDRQHQRKGLGLRGKNGKDQRSFGFAQTFGRLLDLARPCRLSSGMVELLQVTFGLEMLDLGQVGDLVVALFAATWTVSLVYRKARRVEERWTL
jgi:hypothetical protein